MHRRRVLNQQDVDLLQLCIHSEALEPLQSGLRSALAVKNVLANGGEVGSDLLALYELEGSLAESNQHIECQKYVKELTFPGLVVSEGKSVPVHNINRQSVRCSRKLGNEDLDRQLRRN